MKNWTTILLSLIIASSLSACNSKSLAMAESPAASNPIDTTDASVVAPSTSDTITVNDSLATHSAEDAYNNTVATPSNSNLIIDTEYYTLSAPSSWCDNCFYEIAEGENDNYTLSFYDNASHNATNAGWLFSINLLTESSDYSNYPDYDVLGSIEVYRIGSYNVVVTYPTDVQFSDDTIEEYTQMSAEIPNILESISFKEECTFSETPIPVEPDEPFIEVSERYLGRWEDLYIGKGMKFDDYTWNIVFRSDGTGTFEFIYGANNIEYLDFTFSTFLPRDNGLMEGVSIYNNLGEELKVYITCTWNNELQTGVMTLQDWENPDQYWTFKLITQ